VKSTTFEVTTALLAHPAQSGEERVNNPGGNVRPFLAAVQRDRCAERGDVDGVETNF